MGKLTNALQGKLNAGKPPLKGRSERQLDLFMSLSDRGESGSRIPSPSTREPKKEPPAPEPKPEPEMVLPPPSDPPDVSADVRALFSDSDPDRSPSPIDTDEQGKPALRTGIYRRPQRRRLPPPDVPSPAPRTSRMMPLLNGIRDWFEGVELDRRMVSLVVFLILLVAIVAFWSACPRTPKAEPGTTVDLREIQRMQETEPEIPSPAPAAASVAAASSAAALPASVAPPADARPVAADWNITGAETTMAGGTYRVKFTDPVFVSANYLSPKGVKALKSLAAKLVTMKDGARVVVTGHTDDIPLSKPTPQFRNNADLAEARAKAAMEHLSHYARANKALIFEMRAGTLADAPYPNDSDRNRRLNRTATVQVTPAKN